MNLKEIKLLYLSCHETLEQQELQLFSDMGIDVFSLGAYTNPDGHPSLKRPPVTGLTKHPEFYKYDSEYPKTNLPKEFFDNFNVVMVMHTPEWITENWEKMKDKKVIWRSIGQSNTNVENMIRRMRYEGMKVVRYSPMEENIPANIGSDATIRFYEDENDLKDWNGNTKRVINITQSLKGRGDLCHYNEIMQIISGFPSLIYGTGNDNLGPLNGGSLSYDLIKGALRDNRAFVYGGTWPACYTLSFIEALMTGIPEVSIGPKLAEELPSIPYQNRFDFFEIPQIITNGKNGFYSDDVNELRGYIDKLLEDQDLAKRVGEEGRKTAIKLFSKEKARENWTKFFDAL
jgi:glycosyltransferase involved in cell wall biosynthesis